MSFCLTRGTTLFWTGFPLLVVSGLLSLVCLQSYLEDPYYTIYTVSTPIIRFVMVLHPHLIIGSKCISILGAAHAFNHEKLREETLRRYPDIANEQNNQGLLALIQDHIINLDFLHNPKSTQPDVEKCSPSSYEWQNTRKDAVERSDSEPLIGKKPDLVNSQGHTPTFDVNMPSPALNDGDNLKVLRPVRRRPDGA